MEIAENFFLEMEKLYKDANLPIFVSGISLGGLVSLMLGVKFG